MLQFILCNISEKLHWNNLSWDLLNVSGDTTVDQFLYLNWIKLVEVEDALFQHYKITYDFKAARRASSGHCSLFNSILVIILLDKWDDR